MAYHFTKEQIDQIGRIAQRVARLQDRCDAFFKRREDEDRAKAARKAAKRDAKRADLARSSTSKITAEMHPHPYPGLDADGRHREEPLHFNEAPQRHDSTPDALQRLHNLRNQLPKQLRTSEDIAEFSAVQAKADSVFQELAKYGKGPGFAPQAKESEGLYQYRYRLADAVKKYSPQFRDINLTGVGISAFRVFEPQFFADAIAEAQHPTQFGPDELRELTRYDEAGRRYSEFYGHPSAWMSQFSGDRKRLTGIRCSNIEGYHPNNLR